jgi:hypothetical protein
LKTHSAWTYEVVAPGVFIWTSPHGYRYLRDHTGTRPLDPGDRDGLPDRSDLPGRP